MLVSLKVNNVLIYDIESEFSMRAIMRASRFQCNVIEAAGVNLVKSAVILGPNNSGKTNIVRIISALRAILLNKTAALSPNLFSGDSVCTLSVYFTHGENEYCFSFQYDASTAEYVSESFGKVRNGKMETLVYREVKSRYFKSSDRSLVTAMRMAGRGTLLIHALDTTQFPVLEEMKQVLTAFALSIDVIDMNNIPIGRTLDMMKGQEEMRDLITDFVRKADLFLDDFRYAPEPVWNATQQSGTIEGARPSEEALCNHARMTDLFHLESVYKGVHVPSLLYDSTGTKKLAALAGYVLTALKDGRILVVDEIDNSLHFRLTRAIFAMFNNELNKRAQLIATAHDISLLDCRRLFRKEQIWFASKDANHAYLYPLSDFTAREDGVRDTSDLEEMYRRGHFGALPEPELFDSLLEVSNAKQDTRRSKEGK